LSYYPPSKLVLIGASTGGPGQIQKIISALPALQNTSIVIAQHMVKGFIPSFASRLNNGSINPINIIHEGDLLTSSNIYICDGVTSVYKQNSQLHFKQENSAQNRFNPDINHLFNSFAPFNREMEILSVILTGIGDDGVNGCMNLSLGGAKCLTESEKSAIVDGMPSRARSEVKGIEVLDIDGIVNMIKEFCN